MSYILDALKKSDQERQRQQGPTLATIQRPVRSAGRPGRWALALAGLAILACLVAVSVWWYRPIPAPEPSQVPSPSQAATTHSEVSSEAAALAADAAAEPTVDDLDGADMAAPTVAFGDLPDNIRNQIPALTFSFHVYSDKAESRTIIINNRRVREGDNVLQNLQLLEITPQGVVLNWKGHPFFINVVDNW